VLAAARAAGSAIRALASDAEAAERKPDGSLVSVADRAASAIIGPRLRSLDPRLPVICEEAMQDTAGAPRFWLVDPLDGTKEFLSKNGEFTVNVALIEAGRPVAGALNLIGPDALYGRYWGCIEDHPFLHFELCYHQAIDWAIAHGLRRVEAGAQGEHKLARGFEPVLTHSCHRIAHPGFRAAIEDFLARERRAIDNYRHEAAAALPYRSAV